MVTEASRRSSGRSRAAAAAVAAVLVALVAIVLVSFLWPTEENQPRTSVAAYLEEVDAVGRSLAIELQRANGVYGGIGDPKADQARLVADAERGERAITSLERRTRALEPPPEAAAFHAELLSLFALQSSLARDATVLVRYLPAQRRSQLDLAGALARLRKALESRRDPAAQAAAFGRFESDTARVSRTLATVPVPQTLAPLRDAERERAEGLAALGRQIRNALARGDGKRLARLLGQLSEVVARGTSAAQRDAVIAYNRRIETVAERQAAVRAELVALDRRVS